MRLKNPIAEGFILFERKEKLHLQKQKLMQTIITRKCRMATGEMANFLIPLPLRHINTFVLFLNLDFSGDCTTLDLDRN